MRQTIKSPKPTEEFVGLLDGSDVFKGNKKARGKAWRLLLEIDEGMARSGLDVVPLGAKKVQDRFRGCGRSYTVFQAELKSLGVITYGGYLKPDRERGIKGKRREYSLTPKGRSLVNGSYRRKLVEIETTTSLRRLADQARAAKRDKGRHIANPFLRMLLYLNCDVGFDINQAEEAGSLEAGSASLCTVFAIRKGDFKDLRVTKGRAYHPLAAMPKVLRRHLTLGTKRYVGVADMRAAWSTFYARALKSYYDAYLSGELPPGHDYGTSTYLRQEVDAAQLGAEVEAWDAFFCAKADPRDVILRETGLDSKGLGKTEMKHSLNRWVNGGRQFEDEGNGRIIRAPFPAMDRWFASRFPNLDRLRAVVEPKIVGSIICDFYEMPVMMDMELYAFAETLGFTLSYEYDGVGVFSDPKPKGEMEQRLDKLARKIHQLAVRHTGVPIIIKSELVS